MHETAPLLPSYEGSAGSPLRREPARSAWYLVLLTLPIGGLQVAWSVEFSAGSSYLLSLGMSKTLLSLAWFAGPLMGALVQPWVGALSDDCRLPWGRRRPYLLGGTALTVLSMMVLAWVRELLRLLDSGAGPGSVQTAAVAAVYALSAGLNAVEASARALIADCAPRHQQEAANAMASRSIAVGNLVGFLAGCLDLAAYLPLLGDSHFRVLCAVSSLLLAVAVLASAASVAEEDPSARPGPPAPETPSVGARLLGTIRELPPQIRALFAAQVFACFAFFPVLFYGSVYVAEMHAAPHLRENPHLTPAELDALYEEGTRKGSAALLWNAAVMLVSTLLTPALVTPTYDRTGGRDSSTAPSHISSTMSSATCDESGSDSEFSSDVADGSRTVPRLKAPQLTLRVAWVASLVLQALALLAAPFVQTVGAAVLLIALLGYTWALSAWAPFAIIGSETHAPAPPHPRNPANGPPGPLSPNDEQSSASAGGGGGCCSAMRNRAGAVYGIHNTVICAAQAAATVVSLCVFAVCGKPRGEHGDVSFAVLFGISGVAGVLAVYFALRVREGGESGKGRVAAPVRGRGGAGAPGISDM